MLKMSYAGCLGLFPAISSQFPVKMCATSKIVKNFLKTPFWGFKAVFELREISWEVELFDGRSSNKIVM